MLRFRNKKQKFCFLAMVISLAILLIVFYATDGLLGDKEFYEYTKEDWSIAILPLCIIVISGVSSLIFSFIIIIPYFLRLPAINEYVTSKKFADIEQGTEFIVFDFDEFKRTCCRTENKNGVWISVKEYSLKEKDWKIIEESRHIENKVDLTRILKEDYKYDEVKFYSIPNRQQ